MINRVNVDGEVYVNIADLESHLTELAQQVIDETIDDEWTTPEDRYETLALHRQSALTLYVVTDLLAEIRKAE
jgi:hypothetical protein